MAGFVKWTKNVISFDVLICIIVRLVALHSENDE